VTQPVQDALKKNTDGVIAVLEESGQRLHALLLRLTLRPDVADDLLQELFLKLSRSEAFARAESRTAYAYRAAVHLAFDWRRARQPATTGVDVTDQVQQDSASPVQALVAREQMDQVLEAVGKLNGLQRQALVMHYIQQESFQSIAEQLGKTPHQVRALCHKAIRQLRSQLPTDEAIRNPKEDPRGQD